MFNELVTYVFESPNVLTSIVVVLVVFIGAFVVSRVMRNDATVTPIDDQVTTPLEEIEQIYSNDVDVTPPPTTAKIDKDPKYTFIEFEVDAKSRKLSNVARVNVDSTVKSTEWIVLLDETQEDISISGGGKPTSKFVELKYTRQPNEVKTIDVTVCAHSTLPTGEVEVARYVVRMSFN